MPTEIDPSDQTPTARARALARAGRRAEAEAIIAALIAEEFGGEVRSVAINTDAYSLNSLNGFVTTGEGRFFFKFHQEEGEGRMAGEYYRARILAEAGLPVDLPLHASTRPGRQILLYRLRQDRRLAEVARDLDTVEDGARLAPVIAAQEALDRAVARVYLDTLHPISAAQSQAEPIHRLFHERLRDFDHPEQLGGRFAAFYRDQDFILPGLTLPWRALAELEISFNGVVYRDTLRDLFEASFRALDPALFAGLGVTAHGDAHNANVWVEANEQKPHLTMFDPAFAGAHVPALLAEVKATFHNIFAHPFWLYEPQVAAERFTARVERRGGILAIETDWTLSPLRRAFLTAKRDLLWRPLLAEMQARGALPADWRRRVKLALFCCPTLVMNLRAGGAPGPAAHNAQPDLVRHRPRHCRHDGQCAQRWGRGRALDLPRRDRTNWFRAAARDGSLTGPAAITTLRHHPAETKTEGLPMNFRINRRQMMAGAAAFGSIAAFRPAFAQDIPAKPEAGGIKMGLEPWLGYGQWHVANKKGLFKAQGLDSVELVNFTQDADLNAALASGQLDCANVATHTAMAFAAAGLPIKIVMLLDVSMTADAILSDGSVNSIPELKGKQVAYEEGTTSDLLLNYALAANGMTVADIQKVPMPAADAGSALIAGKVPVAVTYEPYLTTAKSQNPKVKMIYSASVEPGLISDVLVVNEKFLQEKPGQILALVKTWGAAEADYEANTKDDRAIIAQAVGDTPENLATAFEGVKFYSLAENKTAIGGDFPGKVMPAVKDAATKAGILTKDIDPTSLLDPRFVAAA